MGYVLFVTSPTSIDLIVFERLLQTTVSASSIEQLCDRHLVDDLPAVKWEENPLLGGAVSGASGSPLAAVAVGWQTHPRGPDLDPDRWVLPGTAQNAHTGSQQRVRPHI